MTHTIAYAHTNLHNLRHDSIDGNVELTGKSREKEREK